MTHANDIRSSKWAADLPTGYVEGVVRLVAGICDCADCRAELEIQEPEEN
jgi:hypothetical protein